MERKPRNSRQATGLLAAMSADAERWRYGYELSEETGLRSGTLYPLLIRLSDRGWLEARWTEPEREGRPPRHEYRLTADGAAFAREQGISGKQKRRVGMKGAVTA